MNFATVFSQMATPFFLDARRNGGIRSG